MHGDGGNDIIRGESHSDTLYGGEGNDRLLGDADNDLLRGEGGNDFLNGGTGQDALIGGAGDNRLIGGADADLFVFSLNISDGRDVVMDFDPSQDRMTLNYNYNGGPDALACFTIFQETALQRGDHVTFRVGDGVVMLRDTVLTDISVAHFLDSSAIGGWQGWIDG